LVVTVSKRQDDRVHNRRARPTLRVLNEDLTSGWTAAEPQRKLSAGDTDCLHPLSELPHPIVKKAVESFGPDSSDDNYVGPIASSTRLPLLEIKSSQWRGGVWEDPESGVCWLLVAGLAKGNHQDHDDFYRRIQRETESGDPSRWLPTEADQRLLKRETAARLRTEWELAVQSEIHDALKIIHAGGRTRINIHSPVPGHGRFAQIDLTVTAVREEDYEADEVLVEIVPESRYAGTELLWQLTTRVLISVEPPEQGWDRFKNTYSNIGEPGTWTQRVTTLAKLAEANELAVSEPGTTSHYAHREHLAGHTVVGQAVRALCGVHFVPTQDHESLSKCPTCEQRFAELPD
jgi:hypothetical protein